jgi:hypothetical protein
VVAGAVLGIAGAIAWPPLLWAFALPAGYLLAVLVGSAVTARGLPGRSRWWLPVVYATMHGSWGAGFLSSVKRYTRRSSP